MESKDLLALADIEKRNEILAENKDRHIKEIDLSQLARFRFSDYVNKYGIKDLEECLRGKQAIFIGNSGVGKSSLLNELISDDKTKIGQISNKSKKYTVNSNISKFV